MRTKFKSCNNGCTGEHLFTIDGDQEKVEAALVSGGHNETGYDYTELVGVEIIKQEKRRR